MNYLNDPLSCRDHAGQKIFIAILLQSQDSISLLKIHVFPDIMKNNNFKEADQSEQPWQATNNNITGFALIIANPRNIFYGS